MVLDTLSERERELRINRTIYWLGQGVPPDQLDAARIDVSPDDLPALVDTAKRQMIESQKDYADATRKGALGYMAFGVVMLGLAHFLSQGDVPLAREGRLLLVIAVGGVSLAWGLFRFFNQNSDYHF